GYEHSADRRTIERYVREHLKNKGERLPRMLSIGLPYETPKDMSGPSPPPFPHLP
ncbi:hypothetical protein HAX54_033655, partial [Datura stramonium]|nr:hypothetical protein [Datura stramonium]